MLHCCEKSLRPVCYKTETSVWVQTLVLEGPEGTVVSPWLGHCPAMCRGGRSVGRTPEAFKVNSTLPRI